MFGKFNSALKLADAERKIIDYSVAEGLKYLGPQRDTRNQAKLVVSLYAWAVHLTYSAHVRQLSEDARQGLIIQTGNAAINRHTRDEHNGYVQWLMKNAAPGDGLLAHKLVREAFPFLFYRVLRRLWMVPSLEENIRPNTLKQVFEEWANNPEFINQCVDLSGLTDQLDDLCVACSVAAANTYGLTTGRLIHRSVVPMSASELPAYCDVFISYAAEDRTLASSLAAAMQTTGLSPWFDQSITPQGRFDRQINTYLDDAPLVIVLWSSRSVNSQWVRGEALRAIDQGKLFNVVIDGASLPVPFNTVQAYLLNSDTMTLESSLTKLAGQVHNHFPAFQARV